jgi:predicted P-loop ATPase
MELTLIEKAQGLAFAGIPVFPLTVEKRPVIKGGGGFTGATTDPGEIERMFSHPRAALIGVPMGAASGFDAIDIDVRPDRNGMPWLTANEHRLPKTRRHFTRSGGVHLLFKHRPGLSLSLDRLAPGVEVKTTGSCIVWWPEHGCAIDPAPVMDRPEWLEAEALREVRGSSTSCEAPPPSAREVISLLRAMPNPADADRDLYVAVNLAVQGCIRAGLEADTISDDEAEEVKDAAAAWSANWDSTSASDYEIERRKWETDWPKRQNDIAGWRHLLCHAERLGVDVSSYDVATARAEFAAVPLPPLPVDAKPIDWKKHLQRNEKGKPLANLLNAMCALRLADEWRDCWRLDEFTDTVMLFRNQFSQTRRDFKPRAMRDDDATLVAAWLQSKGIQVSSKVAHEAIVSVAHKNSFDPIADYLGSLRWDGSPRIDTWLEKYLGAKDGLYVRAVSARSLIAAVARALEPGCQVDTVTLLEGPQGIKKSSAIRAIFGDVWFTDHLPDLTSKDALEQLRGIWCLEFAELDKLGKAEASRAKSFISTRVDRYRPSYGRVARDFPRRCVFWGTLNPGGSGYLRDETGNRRYWPVVCATTWSPDRIVDEGVVRAIKAVRDQMWAEAVHRWKLREPHWFDTPELVEAQAAEVGSRFLEDPWTEMMRVFLQGRSDTSVSEILGLCLNKPPGQWTQQDKSRVGSTLAAMGWVRKQVRVDHGHREWRYVNPVPPLQDQRNDDLACLAHA